jgi:protein NEDD1
MKNDPITPVPAQKKSKKGMNVLGLGTPEVERWVQAGKVNERNKPKRRDIKGKGKTVGFQDELADSDEENDNDDSEKERERDLSMQISPRRPAPGVSASGSTDSWAASPAVGPSPGGSSAHELLKTIVQDVMYDFQRESKAEMMGLHLDLLRMGRGWKAELRTLMDEYVGDLKDLREENQRLRLENERLRRGAY